MKMAEIAGKNAEFIIDKIDDGLHLNSKGIIAAMFAATDPLPENYHCDVEEGFALEEAQELRERIFLWNLSKLPSNPDREEIIGYLFRLSEKDIPKHKKELTYFFASAEDACHLLSELKPESNNEGR